MIRRDSTAERELTIFVDLADLDLEHADPNSLAVGRFYERHPHFGAPLGERQLLCSAGQAAALVQTWTSGARVFGVVPSFDTGCLEELLHRHGLEPQWHFQPWDIAVLAVGYLIGRQLPVQRSSEATSLQCGVAVPTDTERHTAMGDARWVKRWYDHIMPSPAETIAA